MTGLRAVCLIALLFGGNALAAERLSDPQMDLISAGAVPSCSAGAGCNISSSSTTTITAPDANGVLHTTTTNTGSCTASTCTSQVTNYTTNGITNFSGSAKIGTPPAFPPPPVTPPPVLPITTPSLI
jgi:hypothetical protein